MINSLNIEHYYILSIQIANLLLLLLILKKIKSEVKR